MTFYHEPVRLVEPVGNNAISYAERMALGSQGKLFIPQLINGTLDDLSLGNEIVFEEVENGKLVSCKGLKSLLKITHENKTIYITDNHNHALYFRYDALHDGLLQPGATLLHIDQHADFNEPDSYINSQITGHKAIAEYVNTQTQIASFIKPALQSGLIGECIQIRSEAKLQEIVTCDLGPVNYVVDVDIDFFAHETDITHKMALLQKLLSSASVITIAASPYFIDQQRAIELVRELLSEIDKDDSLITIAG